MKATQFCRNRYFYGMSYQYIQKTFICLALLSLTKQPVTAQNPATDVQHYRFALTLSDTEDMITGTADVQVKLQPNAACTLNLANINAVTGKGMVVSRLTQNGRPVSFTHASNLLIFSRMEKYADMEDASFSISYKGIPADGLIISKSTHNKRTFFGDNWPDRARHWLPCHDVPSDKASVEFIVTAPAHYTVVSNGIKQEETLLNDGNKLTHWKEEVPLPTKVMVIGAADFAVGDAGLAAGGIPVSSYVYAEEKEAGFYDYAQAKDVLEFFIRYIGPYPYKKLANIQSKTIFGGMENASAIFYFEQSVTGKRRIEDLLAHEIVHQWFGNMVTEKSYNHLWLSEGFATYLTNVYIEQHYGPDSLARRMQGERNRVIEFAQTSRQPIVDTTRNYMSLLNANSYQKGGWVLHMLRRTIGDTAFHKTIREYYRLYAGRNADTDDFRAVAEAVSGKKLASFFRQWLLQPGLPLLATAWKYDKAKKQVLITIQQKQPALFTFSIETGITAGKSYTVQSHAISKRSTTIALKVKGEPAALKFDPNTNLLWSLYVPEPVN